MLILKPGYLETEVEGIDINRFVIDHLASKELELINITEKILTRGEVEIIYSSKQDIDESLRAESLNYMSSGTVRLYIVEGANAQQIANSLKKILRKHLMKDSSRESLIKNVVHVPDNLEFEQTYNVLFS